MTRDEFIEQNDQNRATFDEEQTPEEKFALIAELEASNHILRTLGLIEVSADILDESELLLDDFVGGFFDGESRELNVILDEREGVFSPNDIRVYVHEYMHLLQEVGFDTFDTRADLESGDHIAAITTFVEGEAEFFTQLVIWLTKGREYLESIFEEQPDPGPPGGTGDSVDEPSFYLQQSFIFPYTTGVGFIGEAVIRMTPHPEALIDPSPDPDQVAANFAAWSERLNEIHERLPVSTEQVMHVEKYEANELPIEVNIATDGELLAAGWTEVFSNDWGEGGLLTWLESAMNEGSQSGDPVFSGQLRLEAAAAGWGGDELLVINSECGELASVTLIEWDNPAQDALEFSTEIEFWYDRNTEFEPVSVIGSRVTVLSAPSGFLAFNAADDERESVVVTAQSAETAEMLALWALGGAELTSGCEETE